jgi:hypothetical protein
MLETVSLLSNSIPLATAAFFICCRVSAQSLRSTPDDLTRNPANVLFDETGVLINAASALPIDRYATLFKRARIAWLSLQIDNGGKPREDNIAALGRGWVDSWKKAGFKVGFWGAPRGVAQHNSDKAFADALPLVQADAILAAHLTSRYHGDFYIADCEDSYQAYNPKDPAPALSRIYVDAFQRAANSNGIRSIPRALSSEGRVALDMQPWITNGWDVLPQAYWNSYAVYQPSKCIDFYVHEAGWPMRRIHPTIATFTSEGERRTIPLKQYAEDLRTRPIKGFSFYLPESYLGLKNPAAYDELASFTLQRHDNPGQ